MEGPFVFRVLWSGSFSPRVLLFEGPLSQGSFGQGPLGLGPFVKGPLTRVLLPQITSETSTSTVTVFFRGSILPFLQILIFQSFALLKSSFLINQKIDTEENFVY